MLQMSRPRTMRVVVAFFAMAIPAGFPALAGAATFTVNSTADQAPTPTECGGVAGDCALRQAVDKANSTSGPDTVVLPAGRYRLTIPGSGGDQVGDLSVTEGELSIRGAGARHSVIDASGNESRIVEARPGTSLLLSGLTVTGGRTEEPGGGIFAEGASLGLVGVSVSDNESFNEGEGGGITGFGADITIRDSSISGNRNSGNGGGIAAYGEKEDFLSIENSTIADNVVDTSLNPGEPGWGAYGGAMEVDTGKFSLRNVTISGNSIRDRNGGEEGAGAAIETDPGTAERASVVNTIVYGNTATESEEIGQCGVTLPSEGHNLEGPEPEGEPRCFEASSDLIANPLLGPLADNGGETDTMALMTGSPAIDAGGAVRCPATDQRGVARPQFAGCDIGAFELAPPPPPPVVTPPAAPVVAPPDAPVVTPPAAPAATLKLDKVKRNLKKGTATLITKVSGPGKLTLSGKRIVKVKRSAHRAGVVKLLVKARGKVKKALTKKGKVKVGLKVVFAPSGGGAAVSKTKSVVLKKKRRQPARRSGASSHMTKAGRARAR